MSDSDKATLRRIPLEVLNQGRIDVIDQVVSADYIEHTPPPGYPADRQGLKSFVADFRSAIPDLSYEIDREVAEGDTVVQHVTATGTLQREFLGMTPTGKSATWDEIHICRMSGGACAEHWGLVDMLGVLQQLGLMPSQPQAKAA